MRGSSDSGWGIEPVRTGRAGQDWNCAAKQRYRAESCLGGKLVEARVRGRKMVSHLHRQPLGDPAWHLTAWAKPAIEQESSAVAADVMG
jgi:hypothetical protein